MSDPYSGTSTAPTVAAISGSNTTGGIGVWGVSAAGEGVHGDTNGTATAAVAGIAQSTANTVAGVWGWNHGPGCGTFGHSENGEGAHGETNSTGTAAVAGIALNTANTVAGTWGYNHGTGAGAWGHSEGGEGVHGETNSPTMAAVAGIVLNPNSTGAGIWGSSLGKGAAGYFQGNVQVTGDIQLLGGADCAECFDVAVDAPPGAVMVLLGDGVLTLACEPYDSRVAGVVSGAGAYRPGIVLGAFSPDTPGVHLALMGRVACNVDAGFGAVKIGDLLTTSATPGHAMRASDRDLAFGAVIGKAMAPLAEGRGQIPILVALQ